MAPRLHWRRRPAVVSWRAAVTPAAAAKHGGNLLAEFTAATRRTLEDPRGWARFGFQFTPAGVGRPHLMITLATAEEAARMCGIGGFSCWRDDADDVVINLKNWMGGSASGLPLGRYRDYVINHEVGHWLGLAHAKCPGPGRPGSVMQQMTRGPAHVAPCTENEWPLDTDRPRPPQGDAFTGGAAARPLWPSTVAATLAALAAAAALALRAAGH